MSLRARVRLAGSHRGRVASVLAATVAMLAIAMTAQASASVGAPTVSNVTPNEGTALGKEKVRVVGTNLTGATGVYFGANPVERFKVVSPTAIVITTPVGYGTVNVTVVTPEGTSAITPADEFTYIGKQPGVSGVSPKLGPAVGGNSVSITGIDFTGVTEVHFGGVGAESFVVNSPTSITAVAPPETAGRVEVTVTTVYGTSPPQFCAKSRPCIILDYYKFAEPTITELNPDSGPEAGGTSVTVTGTGFAVGVGLTSFSFHAIPASEVECIALTICTLVTPPHKAGTVPVTAAVGEYKTKQPMAAHFVYTR
jgi:IPT/TIG domain